MKLRHIEIFHAIMVYGSVNAAAQHLNTSQPSLSVALKQMEDSVGYQLFERRNGRLKATQKAKILLEQSKKVVSEVQTFTRLASNLGKQLDYSFTIGAIPALTFSVLPKALSQFRSFHSDIHLAVRTTHRKDAFELVARRDLHLAFIFYRGEAKDGMIDIGSTPLVIARPENAKTLDGIPFINTENSGPVGEIARQHLHSDELRPKSMLEVDTYHMAISMVRHGHGYAILDALTASALKEEGVRIEPVNNIEEVRICALIDKDDAPNRKLQTLIRCMRDQIKLQTAALKEVK